MSYSDFAIKSKVCIDSTTDPDYRIIISNGIVDHNIVNNENGNWMCEIPWLVKIPKNPVYVPGKSGVREIQVVGTHASMHDAEFLLLRPT